MDIRTRKKRRKGTASDGSVRNEEPTVTDETFTRYILLIVIGDV